jgi:superfamily II DNA or RNA helicase
VTTDAVTDLSPDLRNTANALPHAGRDPGTDPTAVSAAFLIAMAVRNGLPSDLAAELLAITAKFGQADCAARDPEFAAALAAGREDPEFDAALAALEAEADDPAPPKPGSYATNNPVSLLLWSRRLAAENHARKQEAKRARRQAAKRARTGQRMGAAPVRRAQASRAPRRRAAGAVRRAADRGGGESDSGGRSSPAESGDPDQHTLTNGAALPEGALQPLRPPPTLRDYQLAGVADIRAAYCAGASSVCYVSPTGSGKTAVFGFVVASAVAKGKRVIIATHRAEIADQISQTMALFGVPHGRIQPGHEPTDALCQVAMVQTLKRRLDRVPPPDFFVLDECHHAVSTTWKRVLAKFPNAKVLGVTATPERLDGRGLGDVFDAMVVGQDVRGLIDQCFLADYTYIAPDSGVDLRGLHVQMGDYAVGDIAERVDHRQITGDVIANYRKYLAGCSAIVFTCTIPHAEHVAAQFREAGIPAATINGSMKPEERREIVRKLRDGEIKILASCEVISEGFDCPSVAGAILLRPTASFALYRQQVGRCLRPKPDGSKAIILDHVGNVFRHALPDAPHEWSLNSKARKKKEQSAEVAPVRACSACDAVFPIGTTSADCPDPDADGCIFARRGPIEVAGTLRQIDPQPEWACGINIRTARGRDWFRMLELAGGCEDRLRTIQIIRGFKPGFVFKAMQAAALRRRAAA